MANREIEAFAVFRDVDTAVCVAVLHQQLQTSVSKLKVLNLNSLAGLGTARQEYVIPVGPKNFAMCLDDNFGLLYFFYWANTRRRYWLELNATRLEKIVSAGFSTNT